MRRSIVSVAALTAVVLLAPSALAHPEDGVHDDGNSHEHSWFDGDGYSSVEPYLGDQPAARDGQRQARNVSLVGALRGDPDEFNEGVFADVMGYRDLAFLGKWREGCPGSGVDIIDISRPSAPVKLSDTADHADTSMEDMQAARIGERDVLAIGLQDCGNDATPGVGEAALELYDISDPRHPELLSQLDVGVPGSVAGVHELDLTTTADGRTIALLAVPNLELATADARGAGGRGDLLVVDVSDPTAPQLIGEYGVLGDAGLGLPFYLGVRQGGDPRTLLHSARASKDGKRAYLSYWDAGVVILDISDPAHPARIGRTSFQPGEEGDAHSVDEARGGALLVQADEDFSPFEFRFTSSAFSGPRPAVEGAFTPQIAHQPGRAMTGEVVHVGRGCPAGSIDGTNPDDPYLADPAGRIALVERGGCRFDNKIGRAQLAGATGVVVYNSVAGGEALVSMGGDDPVTLPDGTVVDLSTPSVFVQRSTGLLLRDAPAPVTARAAAVFNGWGYLRFFDISDPAAARQLSTFATPSTNDEAVATSGTWSVHNPEIRGSRVYASWYSDGVRVLDISRPTRPTEIGSWVGAGAPADAPPVNIWSVVPHGSLLLASDRNFGLYVLKHVPPRG